METHALVLGNSYAFREKRRAGKPFLKVKLVDIVGRKGKVKVRFEDGPHPGLEEYVSTRQIVVPWVSGKPSCSTRSAPRGLWSGCPPVRLPHPSAIAESTFTP